MLAQMYQNIVLKNPKAILVLLVITILSFGYYTKDFRLDASSETLLIDGDPDLVYLKEVSERYGSKDFLILTYTPNTGMVTDTSINNLLSLKYKIQSLNWVLYLLCNVHQWLGIHFLKFFYLLDPSIGDLAWWRQVLEYVRID